MHFGSTLRQILNICHIKMTPLADQLGYDVSYISKWISGKKSPSENNIEQICTSIARYCTDSATEKERHALQQFIEAPHGLSAARTERLLADLLLQAYNEDHTPASPPRTFAPGFAGSRGANDQDACAAISRFLHDALRDCANGPQDVILSAQTFLRATSFLDTLTETLPGCPLHLHIFYDPLDFAAPSDYCRFLCEACAERPGILTDISEVSLAHRERAGLFCIVRDHAMLAKMLSPFGGDAIAIVSDQNTVNAHYNAAEACLRARRFDTYRYGDSQYEHYLFKFYAPSADDPVYILTDEMMLPCNDCITDDDFQTDLQRYGGDMNRLQWYANLTRSSDGPINEIYYESVVIDFCRNGRGRISPDDDATISVSPETRRTLLISLIEAIEDARSAISILSDSNPVLSYPHAGGTITARGRLVCLIPQGSKEVTYLMTPFATSSFDDFFAKLLSLSDQHLLRGKKAADFLRFAMRFIPE